MSENDTRAQDREAVERDADTYERAVNLPHDAAVAVAKDLQHAGTRNPASNDVDDERARRAQAERKNEDDR